MAPNYDVTNSGHQMQMTTICQQMKPPWNFSAYATDITSKLPPQSTSNIL